MLRSARIKTEGLDEVGRERVAREAQELGRMGVQRHIVSIGAGRAAGGPPAARCVCACA